MNRILILVALMFAVAISNAQSNQQSNQNVVTIDISKLSPSVQKEIENQQKENVVTEKIEQYGEWAGMGKEIGVAVKEGLLALTTEVEKVSQTDVGKFTMYIIAWKVIGDDAKDIIFGPILLIFLSLIYVFLRYKWYGIKRTKVSKAKKEGPFWNRKTIEVAKYEIFNPNDNDDDSFIIGKLVSAVVYGIFVLIIILQILL